MEVFACNIGIFSGQADSFLPSQILHARRRAPVVFDVGSLSIHVIPYKGSDAIAAHMPVACQCASVAVQPVQHMDGFRVARHKLPQPSGIGQIIFGEGESATIV